MTYEYACESGHQQEVFFTTMKAAEESVPPVCEECEGEMKRIPSVPLGFAFYGRPAGYHKPSPTKRHSTKTIMKNTGNQSREKTGYVPGD